MAQTTTARAGPALQGISLGSVGGIRLSLDYSWFVLFFLILGTFVGVVFPRQVPGMSQTTYLLMGVAGTVGFFLSLLGHELAHAVVARTRGIEVDGITLFIFGGMTRTRTDASSPGDEFSIAGVGPLASLVFAVLFFGLVLAARAVGSVALGAVALQLAVLNLALAVFNLLPGFPLDGGRLLRAALWRSTGDLQRATRAATLAGRWLAWGVVAWGVWTMIAGGGLVAGLWLIFIGWFLENAARSSYQQLLLRQVIRGVRARDAMTAEPETVTPDPTLDVLVDDYFMKRPYNAFPVTEDGIVVGLVTLSQVKKIPREKWASHRVADIMTPLVDTLIVGPEDPMTEVLERMGDNETRRVLVAREWELLGIISGGDVANWLDRVGLVK